MTHDEAMEAVGRGLQATEEYLLQSIRSDKARRTELLAMLDVLPLVATDIVSNIRANLNAKD